MSLNPIVMAVPGVFGNGHPGRYIPQKEHFENPDLSNVNTVSVRTAQDRYLNWWQDGDASRSVVHQVSLDAALWESRLNFVRGGGIAIDEIYDGISEKDTVAFVASLRKFRDSHPDTHITVFAGGSYPPDPADPDTPQYHIQLFKDLAGIVDLIGIEGYRYFGQPLDSFEQYANRLTAINADYGQKCIYGIGIKPKWQTAIGGQAPAAPHEYLKYLDAQAKQCASLVRKKLGRGIFLWTADDMDTELLQKLDGIIHSHFVTPRGKVSYARTYTSNDGGHKLLFRLTAGAYPEPRLNQFEISGETTHGQLMTQVVLAALTSGRQLELEVPPYMAGDPVVVKQVWLR